MRQRLLASELYRRGGGFLGHRQAALRALHGAAVECLLPGTLAGFDWGGYALTPLTIG